MNHQPTAPILPPHISTLQGTVRTTTSVPSAAPRSYWDAIQLYVDDPSSPTVARLYIYSDKARRWFSVDLTV